MDVLLGVALVGVLENALALVDDLIRPDAVADFFLDLGVRLRAAALARKRKDRPRTRLATATVHRDGVLDVLHVLYAEFVVLGHLARVPHAPLRGLSRKKKNGR